MDLSDLKPVEKTIQILHPATSEETGVEVTLMSMEDSRMSKIRRQITDNNLSIEQKGKRLKAIDIEENLETLMFRSMVGWKWGGDSKFKGKKPPFNRANVLKVFAELPWFQKQIEGAINDEAGFFPT